MYIVRGHFGTTSDISNDYIFSKVMAQPQLCLQLIKSALPQLKIKRVYVRSQDGLSANVDAKDVRLDISAYGEGGEMFDIEMQTIRPKYLMQRILYYPLHHDYGAPLPPGKLR
ncbi:PD-(D/E)XK nuclease family transposase [Ligilactobacillus agilis]|uniref:PD-(D/E)XK nuclease family transposase n=1 Tax=Ligilactobacillus agilis TaxID=1601 RepID=UPI001956E638|nr:PD-(D/E)XK nuclease family transposase [Ligilactobacillus agilis]MBM6763884.1 PD-(D/E)XK nuclease family transposase [Ligilactobacillus agilis]